MIDFVKLEKYDDYIIIKLSGIFGGDPDYTNDFKNLISKEISKGTRKILVDFSDVKLFTSKAIGAMVSAHNEILKINGRILPVNVPAIIKKGFELMKIDLLMPIFDNINDAISYLNEIID